MRFHLLKHTRDGLALSGVHFVCYTKAKYAESICPNGKLQTYERNGKFLPQNYLVDGLHS